MAHDIYFISISTKNGTSLRGGWSKERRMSWILIKNYVITLFCEKVIAVSLCLRYEYSQSCQSWF